MLAIVVGPGANKQRAEWVRCAVMLQSEAVPEGCLLCLCCVLQGFLAGASAEIFGAGPVLLQLSKYPQPVLVVLALITAGAQANTASMFNSAHAQLTAPGAGVRLALRIPSLWCPYV